jgi:hypothetical protein
MGPFSRETKTPRSPGIDSRTETKEKRPRKELEKEFKMTRYAAAKSKPHIAVAFGH